MVPALWQGERFPPPSQRGKARVLTRVGFFVGARFIAPSRPSLRRKPQSSPQLPLVTPPPLPWRAAADRRRHRPPSLQGRGRGLGPIRPYTKTYPCQEGAGGEVY